MSQVKQYTVYKFNELPEDIQDKAIESLYDINVSHDWWDFVYDDAKTIGLNITEFDIDRGNIKGKWDKIPSETATLIAVNHGISTETYKEAIVYLDNLSTIKIADNAMRTEAERQELDYDDDTPELDSLNSDFQYAILQDYLSMLRKEYEYLTSKEAIIETILANDYDFTENGKID